MGKYFKNVKSTISNIAQILIVVIFIPVVFLICYMINPGSNSAFLGMMMDFIGQIPLMDVTIEVIKNYFSFNSQNISEITLTVLLKAFPDAVFVSVVVYACNTFFVHMWRVVNLKNGDPDFFVKPLTVLPTFVGIFICTLILKLLEKTGNVIAIISEIAVIAILIFGLRILFKSLFGGRRIFSVEKILALIIDGIYAVVLICYIAIMAVVSFSVPRLPFVEVMKYVSQSLVAVVLASTVVWFARGITEKFN